MFRKALCIALLVLPAAAMRGEQEHLLEEAALSHDTEGQQDMQELLQLDSKKAQQFNDALTSAMSSEEDTENAKLQPLVDHSVDLLSRYTNLSIQDHEVASALQESKELAEAVASNFELTKTGRGKAHEQKALASLLERTKAAVSKDQANKLEASLKRKDATPCACFLESVTPRGSWNKIQLANLDEAPSYGYGYCPNSCLGDCKRMGAAYKFDPHEAEEIGAQDVHESVVAAQCKGTRCMCLEATTTTENVLRAKAASHNRNLDIVKELGPQGNYVSQEACLQNCHCSDSNGLDWEGLCMDEWYQHDSYQQPAYGGHNGLGGHHW